MKRPRTIQIFLPSGDPSGIRTAEVTTSIVRVIDVPRARLTDFLSMQEAAQVGLYFLVGGDEQGQLYIGQSGSVGARLVQHSKNESKEWDRALVLVSLTNNLTQTHVLYLESISIDSAKKSGRFDVLNGNAGQRPFTPVPLQADCDEIQELGSLLLTTLGFPVFEPLVSQDESVPSEAFFLRRPGVDAKAFYTNEGLVVLKDSYGVVSASGKQREWHIQKRQELLDAGVMMVKDEKAVFVRDHLFKNPGGASNALLLYPANGWMEWKRSDGKTLHDLHRAPPIN